MTVKKSCVLSCSRTNACKHGIRPVTRLVRWSSRCLFHKRIHIWHLLITHVSGGIHNQPITEGGVAFLCVRLILRCPLVLKYLITTWLHQSERRSQATWHYKSNVTFSCKQTQSTGQDLQTNIWKIKSTKHRWWQDMKINSGTGQFVRFGKFFS